MVERGFRSEVAQGLGAAIGSGVVTAIPLIWGALQGAPGYLVVPAAAVTFASVYWLWTTVEKRFFPPTPVDRPHQSSEALVRREPPKQKALTTYDLETRLRAIDTLLSTIKENLMPLKEEAQHLVGYRLHSQDVEDKQLVSDLKEFGERTERAIRVLYSISDEYLRMFEDDLGDTIKSAQNLFSFSGAAIAMSVNLIDYKYPFRVR